ncbi:MAG: hypothetical protein ACMXYL_03500 [Candidatus Woesearchaeota archaeon]
MATIGMQEFLLAAALAILIAIAISLKALFAIERRMFRMEAHILKLSNKILEEEDQIELLLRQSLAKDKKAEPTAVKKASSKKAPSRKKAARKSRK